VVASRSIRPRILKAHPGTEARRFTEGCIPFDPSEDTERSGPPTLRWPCLGCIPFDPSEDTERAAT